MNELERIVRETARLAAEGAPYLLATVVRVEGSSYRRPGARMLVAGNHWLSGCVSGGCLEGDVMMRGAHRAKDGAVVVRYDTTTDGDSGDANQSWLGCNGIVDVLLEHVPAGSEHDAIAFARACFAAERTGTLVTVIRSSSPDVVVGERIAMGPPTELAQPVRDPAVRVALERLARGPAGVFEADGLTVLVERIAPSPQLFVLGAGHDAAPVVTLATSVGMRVTVADRAIREPSRFLAAHRQVSTGGDLAPLAGLIAAATDACIVIMQHHLAADRAALAMALASRARYIGMLGPARRTQDLLADLGSAGDPRIHAPIGIDLGAETPEQIALSIIGEVQAVLHRTRAGLLRDRARPLHAEVAVAVLAAGGSRRLGHPKQLVRIAGEPLVRRVAATCVAANAGPVAVVLGAHAEVIADALGALPIAVVPNAAWEAGIASSIVCAVRWAETTRASALVIVLGDQPLLTADHVTALRDAWLTGAPIAASRFAGTVGAPAIFDRSRWSDLARLDGDQGAGRIIRSAGPDVVAIDWADGAVDVDTPADLATLGPGDVLHLLYQRPLVEEM